MAPKTAVCDVCGRPLTEDDCYLATTREVTTNKRYWLFILSMRKQLGRDLLREDDKNKQAAQWMTEVGWAASSDSPWIICPQCVNMFPVDRAERKRMGGVYLSTGEPSGGFRVCRYLALKDGSLNLEADDAEGLRLSIEAAFTALKELASQ